MTAALLPLLAALAAAAPASPADPEARIVAYLKEHVKPGQPVVVTDLYNRVFTAPDERAALDRMFNTFFRIPLFAAQHQEATGRPPSLREIREQFRFRVPGQAEVMLRIMEADPRMPRFLVRDARTGEIQKVDVDQIRAHPRFGKALERTIGGLVGGPAPAFSIPAYDGSSIASSMLAGRPYLLYFWFTDCPPCVSTSPLLAELYRAHGPRGLEVVAVNADRVLDVPATDAERAAYAEASGFTFRLGHLTPEMQAAYGQVSTFPTFVFVDAKGIVVEQRVSAQTREALEAAVRRALP